MSAPYDSISLGPFACAFGDLERKPADIADFDALWQAQSADVEFATMGCGSFRTMSGPVETYVLDCVRRLLDEHGAPAGAIDHVIFATSDACLEFLGRDFAVRILEAADLTNCVPTVLSFQQCCSSLAALRYACDLFADEDVSDVVVLTLDVTPRDDDRVRSFALFSDAVTGCVVSRGGSGPLRLVSTAVNVDHEGLLGRDSFLSRQQAAQGAFTKVFRDSGEELAGVTKVFPTNLYRPVTLFNATITGVHRDQLHFAEPLASYGHCGNGDWVINLVDYHTTVGIRSGETYLAQASAPGFFACGLLVGT
ncbi:beta-ketoacyl-[acyl-carrier-protein] synthase family protein [Salinactinospora qingdaonensis]|uniref:Beta-ketoacyl-[acyl-carrier-protein] synthase III N-terminal domain-containing protein n=1 Tax=Salinactinospora qingdaonensis TaxID=702744 RepID=A0ABP7G0U8_9ACTN